MGVSSKAATANDAPIVFFVRLDKSDWNDNQGAWNCSALRIPAVEVQELRSEGKVLSINDYAIDTGAHLVRWVGSTPPSSVAVRLQVGQTLVTAQRAAAEKKESNARVALISALATVLAATIPSIIGFIGHRTASAGEASALGGVSTAAAAPLTPSAPPSAVAAPVPSVFEAHVTYDEFVHAYRAKFAAGSPKWIEEVVLGRKAGSYTLSLLGDLSETDCECSHPVRSPAYTCSAATVSAHELKVQTEYNDKPSNEPFFVRCRKR